MGTGSSRGGGCARSRQRRQRRSRPCAAYPGDETANADARDGVAARAPPPYPPPPQSPLLLSGAAPCGRAVPLHALPSSHSPLGCATHAGARARGRAPRRLAAIAPAPRRGGSAPACHQCTRPHWPPCTPPPPDGEGAAPTVGVPPRLPGWRRTSGTQAGAFGRGAWRPYASPGRGGCRGWQQTARGGGSPARRQPTPCHASAGGCHLPPRCGGRTAVASHRPPPPIVGESCFAPEEPSRALDGHLAPNGAFDAARLMASRPQRGSIEGAFRWASAGPPTRANACRAIRSVFDSFDSSGNRT